MNKFTKKLNTKNNGFTLVETLVAIAILLLAVTAAFSAAQMGLSSSYYANSQTTAFYLAQDAVEFIREIRDHNSPLNWLSGLSTCVQTDPSVSVKCEVDTNLRQIYLCGSSCRNLKLDSATGLYNYTTGSNTGFTRSVTITSVNAYEVRVMVKVGWKDKIWDKSFVVRENLMNIR